MKKLFFIFLVLSSINLFAHRVDIFPYIENGKIVVEGYFSDGTPARNSKVKIYNENGEKIAEGKTDEKGICSFPIPENTDRLKISLIAGMGHRTETSFSIGKEIEQSGNEVKKEEGKKTKNSEETNKKIETDEVEKAVEEAIKPLIKMMEEERRRIKISDVIGGIGYILGIFGLIALLYKRK